MRTIGYLFVGQRVADSSEFLPALTSPITASTSISRLPAYGLWTGICVTTAQEWAVSLRAD